jgi:uncharacterized protein (DUF1684 family)|tara:strand:+ start:49503 stop:50114 length:612 start_codon:yes stop_codon:yes gene_type:complete
MKLFLVLVFTLSTLYSYSQTSYFDSIISERKSKEIELLNPVKGILTEEDLNHFEGLHYFYIDSSYIVEAKFEKSIGKKFEMPTSTERTPIYRRYGYLKFNLNGKELQLTVYQNLELKGIKKYKNYFFVPFRDMTSSKMTYGGGRYLDLTMDKNQIEVIVDFNLAYNPYCAYSHRYSCPIPPEENTLKTFIYSGEKTPFYKEEE